MRYVGLNNTALARPLKRRLREGLGDGRVEYSQVAVVHGSQVSPHFFLVRLTWKDLLGRNE